MPVPHSCCEVMSFPVWMEALPALPTGLCGSSFPAKGASKLGCPLSAKAQSHGGTTECSTFPGPPAGLGIAAGVLFFFFSQLSCGATSPPSSPTDGASIKFRNPFFNRTFTSAPCRAIKAIMAELSKESWEPLELSSHVYGPGNVCFIKDSGAISERLRSVLPITGRTLAKG